jgi:HPt (histidine-containing phosphotransfer) domain-containing protein
MPPRKHNTAPPVTVEHGKDHSVIHPKNLLRRRAVVMQEGPSVLDETAVRRAEQALKALSVQFNGWMEEAARNLAAKWTEIRGAGYGEGRFAAFHRDAHDIRGQATTLGFPLASRVGASLCLILEDAPKDRLGDAMVAALIGQHVDAIRAITREGVMKAEHPVGERLTEELELVAGQIVANLNGAKLH